MPPRSMRLPEVPVGLRGRFTHWTVAQDGLFRVSFSQLPGRCLSRRSPQSLYPSERPGSPLRLSDWTHRSIHLDTWTRCLLENMVDGSLCGWTIR